MTCILIKILFLAFGKILPEINITDVFKAKHYYLIKKKIEHEMQMRCN